MQKPKLLMGSICDNSVCDAYTLPKKHYFPFDVSQDEAVSGEIFG
jgi:hypothetical protein